MEKKLYLEITKRFDGEAFEKHGPFESKEELYKALNEIVIGVYVKETSYMREIFLEENKVIIDFGSHSIFGRRFEEE